MSEKQTPAFRLETFSLKMFFSEHPKNKGLYKPHLLRRGAFCFFDMRAARYRCATEPKIAENCNLKSFINLNMLLNKWQWKKY